MKSKIYNNLAILMFAVITSSSCSDSFLDTAPIMSETESSFYRTDEQMFKALTACYDPLAHIGGGSGNALASIVPMGESVRIMLVQVVVLIRISLTCRL